MRSVLFVDPPAFCTTLEELVAPALRCRPLAVAPPAADRASILALSAKARRAGIDAGMPVRKAVKLCPDLIVLPPNPELYARASRALHQILRAFAPIIEPRGYGHAFLDLTGTDRLFGPPQDVAARIRREVRDRLRLPLSVGIATNKLVSQAAIRADRRAGGQGGQGGQADRNAGPATELLCIPAGGEGAFLAPQPLEVLPELNPRIRARLDDYQLELIGEVAVISEDALCAVFGQEGRILRARARGIDPRPVLPPERQSEFRLAHTLATETNDLAVLHPLLRLMSQRLGSRLRRYGFAAGRVRLELTYADYSGSARSAMLKPAILDQELWQAAQRAFALANTRRQAVRAVALMLDQLEESESQLELWNPEMEEEDRGKADLQHALDRIHARYGAQAIMPGRLRRPSRTWHSLRGLDAHRPAES